MQTTASLNLLNMDFSLLDQNTVSIIRSPNKQFYYMAALDSNDLEQFCATRDFKLRSNVLGYNSNDEVNGWHLHSSEQKDSSDNILTGMTYYTLNEQRPNYEMKCICYPVSSELMSMKTQKSFDVSNSCGNLAVAQDDAIPVLPNTSSEEAVLQAEDVAERNRTVSLEGVSHSNNDIVKTRGGLAKLNDPVDVPLRLQGCHNPVKSRRSPRKSVKKSKSCYNNFNNSRKNCEQRPDSESETAKQNSVRMKSEMNRESVISNGFSEHHPCSSQLSSHPTLSHHVNNVVNSKSENSDGKRDSESSGNEDDMLTSGVTSTGHESTAIDQIWDGYQVPLYVAISDDSTEEKLDATHLLQSEWQPMADDEFMDDFSDFGSDFNSHSQHQTSEVDSDTDAEEMLHLIKESSDALRLTRSSLSQLKLNNGSTIQTSFHREPLATCTTNINCLRDLLAIVSEKDWTHADVNQLSDLLKQWEDVESEFLRLTFQKNLSIAHSDVIIDVSPKAVAVSSICQRFSNSSSDIDMTLMESSSSPNCYFKCSSKSFANRFDIFNSNVNKLLKATSQQHQSTLAPIQIVFFIMMFFIFLYFFALKSHWTDVVGIKFEPQLRYVIGPPPF